MKIISSRNINASSNDPTTTNFADFGARERRELIEILQAWDNRVEMWYYTPYAGHEGFLNDLIEEYIDDPDNWDEEDVEYLRDLGADI